MGLSVGERMHAFLCAGIRTPMSSRRVEKALSTFDELRALSMLAQDQLSTDKVGDWTPGPSAFRKRALRIAARSRLASPTQ